MHCKYLKQQTSHVEPHFADQKILINPSFAISVLIHRSIKDYSEAAGLLALKPRAKNTQEQQPSWLPKPSLAKLG